jgi:hypothetical protein
MKERNSELYDINNSFLINIPPETYIKFEQKKAEKIAKDKARREAESEAKTEGE